MTFTVYKKSTGEVVKVKTRDASFGPPDLEEGEALYYGFADGVTQYLVETLEGPMPVPRPPLPAVLNKSVIAADNLEEAALTNLPPCTVYAGRDAHRVTDGVMEFVTPLPGRYVFRVEAFPYLDTEFTVEAV